MTFHRFLVTVEASAILFKATDVPDALATDSLDTDDLFEVYGDMGGVGVVRIEHASDGCEGCEATHGDRE